MEGWIKLHRKITESPLFENPKLLKMWIWCMCNAAHTQHEIIVGRKTITLNPGEFVFGRKKAARELEMSEGTVYDYMHLLEKRGSVSLKPNNKYTLVKVENWGVYQSNSDIFQQQNEQVIEQQKETKKGQQKDTTRKWKESEKRKEEKKNIIISDSKESDRQTKNVSDIPMLTLTEALSAVNDVSEKRGLNEELKNAFKRWVTHKYNTGDVFKNYYAVDKVGQAIESHSKTYNNNRYDNRLINQVIKLIDYCISTRSKSLCWSGLYKL